MFNILIGSRSRGFREMGSGTGNSVIGAFKMIPCNLFLLAFVTLCNHLPLCLGQTE